MIARRRRARSSSCSQAERVAPQAVDLDGSSQGLTDAGAAFEALHLGPRLSIPAGGGGVAGGSDSTDSSSDSSSSSSSSGDSSDSSDDDEAGGADLLGASVEVAARPGMSLKLHDSEPQS